MKPALVFLHGWAQSPLAWRWQRAWFESRGFRVKTPGLPGHGDAPDAPGEDWTGILARALPDAPLVLVGWSLGGLLAMKLALAMPKRVAGLALVGATPCFRARPDWPHGADEASFLTFVHAAESGAPRLLQRFFLLMLHGESFSRAEMHALAQTVVDKRHPPTRQGLLAGLSLLESCDLRPESQRIHTPTLVVHGEQDAVTPPAAGRWLAEHLPRGRWHPMPGGHAPHLAQPKAFNQTLEAWCETII